MTLCQDHGSHFQLQHMAQNGIIIFFLKVTLNLSERSMVKVLINWVKQQETNSTSLLIVMDHLKSYISFFQMTFNFLITLDQGNDPLPCIN